MKDSIENLNHLRTQVDELDAQLLVLLSERLSLARRMGQIKNAQARPMRDPTREQQVLRRLTELNSKLQRDVPQDCLEDVFHVIMDWSLKVQLK